MTDLPNQECYESQTDVANMSRSVTQWIPRRPLPVEHRRRFRRRPQSPIFVYAVLLALIILFAWLCGRAQAQTPAPPTIGTTCKRVDRPTQGDTVWLVITPRGDLAICAELHDAFHRTRWIVAFPDRNDFPTFSTEAMAIGFIEKQPVPKTAK